MLKTLSRAAFPRRLLCTAAKGFVAADGGTKPVVVVLGSGWGGYTVAKGLDKSKYDVKVVSPANHFLFTPMLPSSAVGSVEFRVIQEPVRTIPSLGDYFQAKARRVDWDSQKIFCEVCAIFFDPSCIKCTVHVLVCV